MEVKDVWTDKDFNEMTWHDNYVHSMSFPGNDFKLIFDIDYVFKMELSREEKLSNYWVSPCLLIFLNVLYLKIDIDFKNAIGLDINSITRLNSRPSPNEKAIIWDYVIETENGLISFESTGYIQKVKKQPVLTNSLLLPREEM